MNSDGMKIAICQVADTGPLESLVTMLGSVGYKCVLPNSELRSMLVKLGCDTVLSVEQLVDSMGYERPIPLEKVGPEYMKSADLYVDVKAYRNGPKVWKQWSNLRNKTLFYRINGGKPEITSKGDEIDLPCPILTPNRWYETKGPWSHHSYTCWPPFLRFNDYRVRKHPVTSPVCLIHNVRGWGYRDLVDVARAECKIKIYGRSSPDGLISHSAVPEMLSQAICMVHLKSNDAPGYALYEALAASCPLAVTKRLIWRCRMEDLFTSGLNCLTFDRRTHNSLTESDVKECTREIKEALTQLSDPSENKRIGEAGHNRLKEIMWSTKNPDDVGSLQKFMDKCFP